MQVNISSQHFSMGESLQEYINQKLKSHVSKYFDHTIKCDVHFDKINHLFLCDIVAYTGDITTIVSDGSASEARRAAGTARCRPRLTPHRESIDRGRTRARAPRRTSP